MVSMFDAQEVSSTLETIANQALSPKQPDKIMGSSLFRDITFLTDLLKKTKHAMFLHGYDPEFFEMPKTRQAFTKLIKSNIVLKAMIPQRQESFLTSLPSAKVTIYPVAETMDCGYLLLDNWGVIAWESYKDHYTRSISLGSTEDHQLYWNTFHARISSFQRNQRYH